MKKNISTKLMENSDEKALIPFLTCGYPDMESFKSIALSVAHTGVDILEIGFPFSDPLADGPTIQYSSGLSLKNGFTLDKGFESITQIADKVDIPLVIMTYINIILAVGEKKFIDRCSLSGVSGVIVPDLPFDLAQGLIKICSRYSIDLILLVSPTTDVNRIEKIADACTGFLYLVSIKGTTGRRRNFPKGTVSFIKKAKIVSSVPVMVGFGISGPSMAKRAARYSDGVIVGSALIDIIKDCNNSKMASQRLIKFLNTIKKEINS